MKYNLIFFLNLLSLVAFSQTISFNIPAFYQAEGEYDMQYVDYNNDNVVDILTVSGNKDTVSLLIGNGDGSFNAPFYFKTNPSPTCIETGDFNNDGNADFILGQGQVENNSLYIFFGNGENGVTNISKIDTGIIIVSKASVFASHLNNDDNLDVAYVYMDENDNNKAKLTILLGNGDGTFQDPLSSQITNAGPSNLICKDFNHDGYIDIAIINSSTYFLYIYENDGNGNFTMTNYYPLADFPSEITANYLNSDSHIDLAISHGGADEISILYGNGDATFISTNISVNEEFSSIVSHDFNEDGYCDLAVSSNNGVEIYQNNNNVFEKIVGYVTGDNGQLISEDFNNDGKYDIAGMGSGNNIAILLNATATSIKKDNPIFVKLFPNPVKDVLYIEGVNKCKIEIITSVGTTVYSKKIKSQEEIRLNVSSLKKGFYSVIITTNDNKYYRKVLIN